MKNIKTSQNIKLNKVSTGLAYCWEPADGQKRYMDDILFEYLIPFIPFIGDTFLLFSDSGRLYSATVVDLYLEVVEINFMRVPQSMFGESCQSHSTYFVDERVGQHSIEPHHQDYFINSGTTGGSKKIKNISGRSVGRSAPHYQ